MINCEIERDTDKLQSLKYHAGQTGSSEGVRVHQRILTKMIVGFLSHTFIFFNNFCEGRTETKTHVKSKQLHSRLILQLMNKCKTKNKTKRE